MSSRACAAPARCTVALARRCAAAAARSAKPQAPPASARLQRRQRLVCRAAGVPLEAADNAPWWLALDELYVLTFDAGSPDEGIYTTTTTAAGGGTRNAFVAFQDASAAASLAARVAAQAGRACGVQGVPPLALLLLGREAGYTVEAVPRGAPFDTPDVLLQAEGEGEEGSEPAADDALEEVVQRMAQRRAAEAVRNALLLPLSRLSVSMSRAAGFPAEQSQAAAPAGGGDDTPPAMPQAASAMATALRAIARRRLEALLPRPESNDDK